MKEKDVRALANEVAGEFQLESDFKAFIKALRKQFWESTLAGELDEHLGYEKHEARGKMKLATAATVNLLSAFEANMAS